MKILVVSNCYPPHFVGGYELGCRDVVDRLLARGHEVEVLTSIFGTEKGRLDGEPHVQRVLNLAIPQLGLQGGSNRRIRHDFHALTRSIQRFAPDVVYFWAQVGLCFWLPEWSRLLGQRNAFFLSDTSFDGWRTGAFLRRWAGGSALARLMRALFRGTRLLEGRPIMAHQPCHFASRFLMEHARQQGIEFDAKHSLVAHWGIEPQRFGSASVSPIRWPPERLLYAGQLIKEKGVHTAIEALALLQEEAAFHGMSLTIAGGSSQPEYERDLRVLAERLGVADCVRFLGKISRESLSDVYREHDVLVFPSIWEEPFAITPLEAMASGMPVVGTLTGGSDELFKEGMTAMTFIPGDAADCARALAKLCSNRQLYETLRHQAANLVTSRHTLNHMVDRIEAGLRDLLN